jgi:N,N'-diacetyllegionaminate synthase
MKSKVIIIAEAGVNHNGSLDLAKKLIEEAANAGADYIKFQTFITENIVSKNVKKASYQELNTKNTADSQLTMLKKLEIPKEWYKELITLASEKGIHFFSTAFDLDSIDFLFKLGFNLFKIPSGEITNKPYLISIAKKRKPVVMSTGMATLDEIKAAMEVLINNGIRKEDITILHCNTEYPTPMQDVNLMAMIDIKNTFGVNIGYSDHTLGIEIPIAAVALGATVIEKHFTLDRGLPGPDHKASLEPKELSEMVRAIRNVEAAISGSGVKEPSPSEIKNMFYARKSIVALKQIKKGELLHEGNLAIKRPGNGLSPMLWDEVIGKKAIKDYEADDLIELQK